MMKYEQLFGDIVLQHNIEVCFRCNCTARTYELGHSRAHAHCEKRKICLAAVPRGYVSFFTALHEIGHIVAENATYKTAKTRALAEHNATEWAKTELRRLGIPVRRKEVAKYNAYIGNKIARGLRRGLKIVPAELRKYAVA